MERKYIRRKSNNFWQEQRNKKYPRNRTFIRNVDQNIIAQMPNSTVTFVEKKSLIGKIKDVVQLILFCFIR
jgi:hypothetical protein